MFTKNIAALLVLLLMTLSPVAQAADVELAPGHPDTYVVVRGDTLWDISARFLQQPWLWPEIWHVNQQIANPHLIYPGDIISLVYIDGMPRLVLSRGDGRLSPRIREESLDQSIPSIPLHAINQFLTRPRLIDDETIRNAPYIVSIVDNRVLAGEGDIIYVRRMEGRIGQTYVIMRKGRPYINPDNNEQLGYEAIYLGEAKLNVLGETSVMRIRDSEREMQVGDFMLPMEDGAIATSYQPQVPDRPVDGQIISVFDGTRYVGQYSIVALNRGTNHGLTEGSVLAIYQKGLVVPDPVNPGAKVQLPDVREGELMVFKAHPKLSYALVLRAFKDLRVNDMVRNP